MKIMLRFVYIIRKYKSGIYNQLGFESSQIIGVRYEAKYGDYSEYRVNGF